jgi:hypothetical protein
MTSSLPEMDSPREEELIKVGQSLKCTAVPHAEAYRAENVVQV